jgi:hypothetical protein
LGIFWRVVLVTKKGLFFKWRSWLCHGWQIHAAYCSWLWHWNTEQRSLPCTHSRKFKFGFEALVCN